MFQFAHCTFAKINSNLKSIISPDPPKYFDYEIQKFEISFKFKSPLSLSAKPQISPGQNINSDKSMNILFGFHFRNKMSSMPMAHLSVHSMNQQYSNSHRGGTQEFELRSIKFKKYISGLRSIFLFQKKHNFA